jgi:hypothetical protein
MSITGSLLIGGVARRGKKWQISRGRGFRCRSGGDLWRRDQDRPRMRGLPLPPVATQLHGGPIPAASDGRFDLCRKSDHRPLHAARLLSGSAGGATARRTERQ